MMPFIIFYGLFAFLIFLLVTTTYEDNAVYNDETLSDADYLLMFWFSALWIISIPSLVAFCIFYAFWKLIMLHVRVVKKWISKEQ